ncbi:MAG: hypothetical protein ABF649_20775 [Bacillus sp. (in: firmicutes)]
MKKLISGRTAGQDTNKPAPESPHSTPRWVKVFGIIVIVLVLLVVIIMIISGGKHGPGRHLKFDNASSQSSPVEYEGQQL